MVNFEHGAHMHLSIIESSSRVNIASSSRLPQSAQISHLCKFHATLRLFVALGFPLLWHREDQQPCGHAAVRPCGHADMRRNRGERAIEFSALHLLDTMIQTVSSASGPNFAASACCDGEVGSRTARAPASTRMLGCMLACFIGRSSRAPGPSEAFRCPPGFLMPRFNIGFVDIPAKMLWVHERSPHRSVCRFTDQHELLALLRVCCPRPNH